MGCRGPPAGVESPSPAALLAASSRLVRRPSAQPVPPGSGRSAGRPPLRYPRKEDRVTLPALDHELDEERTYLADARAALHRMRLHAEALYDTGANVSGDPFGAESLGRALAR